MWRWRHRTLLALAVGAAAVFMIGVANTPTRLVVAATRPFELATDGEYLIQFQQGKMQSTFAARELAEDGIVLEEVATNVPISSATLSPAEAARVADSTGVLAVWPNLEVHAVDTEPNAPWGLDRTDQTELPLDSSYSYSSTGGAGTTLYILDSGINASHVEFTGRVGPGYSAIPGGTGDCNGHGTHVAGIAAGTQYGVAKLATVVPVRVLDCVGQGSDSGVIAGIQWVISQHTTGRAVANLSIGGAPSPILDAAIDALVADGVAVAIAAGNDSGNACDHSPARAASALTVGATDIAHLGVDVDVMSYFSNYGSCVDLFAPGSNILSASIGSSIATASKSGTSMASPHVAGSLALLWTDHSTLGAVQVQQLLLDTTTPDRLNGLGPGSPNLLLYLGLNPVAHTPPTTIGGPGGPTTTTTLLATPAGPAAAEQPARRCELGC